jgi:hypothetical protein
MSGNKLILYPYIEEFYSPGGNVVEIGNTILFSQNMNTSGNYSICENTANSNLCTAPSIYTRAYMDISFNSDSSSNYPNFISYKDKYNASINTYNAVSNKDILDINGNFKLPNMQDAVLDDNKHILIQENTMYILGIIATASLLITAILIARE